jgi:hypothetical protein
MNSVAARGTGSEKKEKKKIVSYTMLVERDSRRIRLNLLSHRGYNI